MRDKNKKIADTFDQHGASYSETVNNALAFTGLNVDYFTKVKAEYLIEALKEKFTDKETSALDIGCGVGNYHGLLGEKISSLYGVDISGESIEIARERNPSVQYTRYDGETLPFEDGKFNVAFTICVMHHVPPAQWSNFVSEMERVLVPGGIALVFEHNPRNPLTMRIVNRCPFDDDAVLLRSSETKQLFLSAGFKEVKSQYILTMPASSPFLRKCDSLLSPLGMGAQYFVSANKKK